MAGRPPETSDGEYLRLIDTAAGPAVFTSEIAEAVGVSQQGAFARLSALRDDGLVDSKKGNERIWWLTETGKRQVRR